MVWQNKQATKQQESRSHACPNGLRVWHGSHCNHRLMRYPRTCLRLSCSLSLCAFKSNFLFSGKHAHLSRCISSLCPPPHSPLSPTPFADCSLLAWFNMVLSLLHFMLRAVWIQLRLSQYDNWSFFLSFARWLLFLNEQTLTRKPWIH